MTEADILIWVGGQNGRADVGALEWGRSSGCSDLGNEGC